MFKYLCIDAYVRYQEDAYINGVQEEPRPAPSRMPGMDGDRWRIVIDLDLCRRRFISIIVSAAM